MRMCRKINGSRRESEEDKKVKERKLYDRKGARKKMVESRCKSGGKKKTRGMGTRWIAKIRY